RIAGRFTLLEFLGAGGIGDVFKARDDLLGRLVSLKSLNTGVAGRADARRLLGHEARAPCSLTHPHICTVQDLTWDGAMPFLVMEYLEGETLAMRIARGPLTTQEISRVASELIAGLAHAHEAGVIHRDVKPGNIMLTSVGVKICDFGIKIHGIQ